MQLINMNNLKIMVHRYFIISYKFHFYFKYPNFFVIYLLSQVFYLVLAFNLNCYFDWFLKNLFGQHLKLASLPQWPNFSAFLTYYLVIVMMCVAIYCSNHWMINLSPFLLISYLLIIIKVIIIDIIDIMEGLFGQFA